MNMHFIFFLIDVLVWVMIAVLLCKLVFVTKHQKVNMHKITVLNIVIITLAVGLFSVLTNGIPDLGLSIKSFIYTFFVSFSLVLYQRIKTKKDFLPKISKRNRKVAYA